MEKGIPTYTIGALSPTEGSILQLPIEQIYAPQGTAKALKRNESIRLARNIEKYGISSPIVVTPTEAFPGFYRYRVQKGAKIWHAACMAGLKTLPCIITTPAPQDPEIPQILADIRQGKLHIFAQAAAIRHLTLRHGLSRADIAKETGFSTSAIANKLRLCRLSEEEQALILQEGLTERHARAVLRLTESAKRLSVLQIISKEKLSVAASEALVEAYLQERAQPIGILGEPNLAADAPTACVQKIPASKPVAGSICPKKFALHTLQPLYNSIERTLSIFRKTGRNAEMQAREGADEVLITIRIPALPKPLI